MGGAFDDKDEAWLRRGLARGAVYIQPHVDITLEVSAGEELVVLKEWENAYLVKDAEGRLFNVFKDQVDSA